MNEPEAAGTQPVEHGAHAMNRGEPAGHDTTDGDHAAHGMTGGEHAGHDMTAGDHDRHQGHSVAMFRDKFWLSLALTVPTVLLSPEVAGWIGYTIPAIPGIKYLPAVLGTSIFF